MTEIPRKERPSHVWTNAREFRHGCRHPFEFLPEGLRMELRQMGYAIYCMPFNDWVVLEQISYTAAPVEKLKAMGFTFKE